MVKVRHPILGGKHNGPLRPVTDMAESSRQAGIKRRNTCLDSRSSSSSSIPPKDAPPTPPSPPPPYHPTPLLENPPNMHPWLILIPTMLLKCMPSKLFLALCNRSLELTRESAMLLWKPTYYEMTLEFLASFQFDRLWLSKSKHDCVRFRIAWQWYEMSLADFGIRMRLYMHRDLHLPVFIESIHEFGEGEAQQVWARIGSGPYDPHRQKSTKILHPVHRYLHRVIVHTIGRQINVDQHVDDEEDTGGVQTGRPPGMYHTTSDPTMLDLMIRMGQLGKKMDDIRQDFYDHTRDPYAHQQYQQQSPVVQLLDVDIIGFLPITAVTVDMVALPPPLFSRLNGEYQFSSLFLVLVLYFERCIALQAMQILVRAQKYDLGNGENLPHAWR
ncbi:hypothetical protein L1987_06466 [Smallanthus sonchifolius]|uniref:Uncharacterized protein n=1 Tax=Smallanthus sonchifolius TaxID=185202 RepID=A0ACB9JY71_9ASTR|nr:hypothetical protein L1987_06466 [Smallanthus sonchifolius]